MAGEQSCGTFTRVAGETDELWARTAATVLDIHMLAEMATSSMTLTQYSANQLGHALAFFGGGEQASISKTSPGVS